MGAENKLGPSVQTATFSRVESGFRAPAPGRSLGRVPFLSPAPRTSLKSAEISKGIRAPLAPKFLEARTSKPALRLIPVRVGPNSAINNVGGRAGNQAEILGMVSVVKGRVNNEVGQKNEALLSGVRMRATGELSFPKSFSKHKAANSLINNMGGGEVKVGAFPGMVKAPKAETPAQESQKTAPKKVTAFDFKEYRSISFGDLDQINPDKSINPRFLEGFQAAGKPLPEVNMPKVIEIAPALKSPEAVQPVKPFKKLAIPLLPAVKPLDAQKIAETLAFLEKAGREVKTDDPLQARATAVKTEAQVIEAETISMPNTDNRRQLFRERIQKIQVQREINKASQVPVETTKRTITRVKEPAMSVRQTAPSTIELLQGLQQVAATRARVESRPRQETYLGEDYQSVAQAIAAVNQEAPKLESFPIIAAKPAIEPVLEAKLVEQTSTEALNLKERVQTLFNLLKLKPIAKKGNEQQADLDTKIVQEVETLKTQEEVVPLRQKEKGVTALLIMYLLERVRRREKKLVKVEEKPQAFAEILQDSDETPNREEIVEEEVVEETAASLVEQPVLVAENSLLPLVRRNVEERFYREVKTLPDMVDFAAKHPKGLVLAAENDPAVSRQVLVTGTEIVLS
jgi:hypothetical protein